MPSVKQAMQSSIEKIMYHTRLGSLWVKGIQKHLRALASSVMTDSLQSQTAGGVGCASTQSSSWSNTACSRSK